MSHDFLTEPIQPTEPAPLSERCRRLFSTLLFQILVLILGVHTFGAGELLAQSNQNSAYAWTLKSGYFTSEPGETVRVLITDATESEAGVEVVVRFFDRKSILLEEVQGETLPTQPLVAKFENNTGERTLIRLEIELLSTDPKVVPVTTLEVDHAINLTATQRFSCAGPLVREPVEFNCGDQQNCPELPPVSEFNCPELTPFPKNP